MLYFRSETFWVLLVAGWLFAATVISILARLFGSFDDMSRAELWITVISIHALGLMAGFAFARSRTPRGQSRGFEVIKKSVDNASTGKPPAGAGQDPS